MVMQFKIGADPELFLINKNGKLISSVGLIGGNKHSPISIGNGCALQEDNVSVEFNIPACKSKLEFKNSILFSISKIEDKIKQYNLSLAKEVASSDFDKDQLNTREAKIFGCEPDYNAWTETINPRPKSNSASLRSCGGHIHVGVDHLDKLQLVKAMDLFLGVPSVIMDKDTKRRQLYGKAGAFRPKEYGVEYRTLSNFWIWKEQFIDWVYEQTETAIKFVSGGNTVKDGHKIQEAINSGDKKLCNGIIGAYNIKLI